MYPFVETEGNFALYSSISCTLIFKSLEGTLSVYAVQTLIFHPLLAAAGVYPCSSSISYTFPFKET